MFNYFILLLISMEVRMVFKYRNTDITRQNKKNLNISVCFKVTSVL